MAVLDPLKIIITNLRDDQVSKMEIKLFTKQIPFLTMLGIEDSRLKINMHGKFVKTLCTVLLFSLG